MMEQHILKPRIQKAIGGQKVKAAVFYTFNFEPAFFENYVLPMLVPDMYQFTNDSIANQMLWRDCIRKGDMPAVTVYCDDYAKRNAEAPMLGYEIRCVRLPEAKGAICNFHPKHTFILLESGGLLLVTGSGNLTRAGWCSNVEAFHIDRFERHITTRQPFTKSKNELWWWMNRVSQLMGKTKAFSEAESMIGTALSYFSPDPASDKALNLLHFSNLDSNFDDFLFEYVFQEEAIEEVEIISPYFSNDSELIEALQNEGIKRLRFLLPVSGNQVLMEESTFDLLTKEGATWHNWNSKELNERLNHAKIYRFYGPKLTYTVIGSVNFTKPAWGQFEDNSSNRANIETAVLHIEPAQPRLLEEKEYNVSGMVFLQKNDLENAAEWNDAWQQRNKPDIAFTIDWKEKKMIVEFLEKQKDGFKFKHILDNQPLIQTKHTFNLDNKLLRQLARNSLIEILESDTEATYFYYPNHLNFEQKPMPLRIAANSILQYWNKLGEETDTATLSRQIADATDEDSGELALGFGAVPSLLNEWAAHFNGLVKLEKFLKAEKRSKKDVEEQARQIERYLLHHSYNTLPFFLDEMRQQYHEEKKHYHSFYWMLLQIAAQNFYGHKWNILDVETNKHLTQRKRELENEAKEIRLNHFDRADDEKWDWLLKQIRSKN